MVGPSIQKASKRAAKEASPEDPTGVETPFYGLAFSSCSVPVYYALLE